MVSYWRCWWGSFNSNFTWPIKYNSKCVYSNFGINYYRNLSPQTALDLLSLADRYCLDELKSSLEQQLCSHVNMKSVLPFLVYCEAHNAQELQERCIGFIECNTHGLLRSNVILTPPGTLQVFSLARSFSCERNWSLSSCSTLDRTK